MRPNRKEKTIAGVTKADLLEFLRQHGTHCLACSTLQRSLTYFRPDCVGYIAYAPSIVSWKPPNCTRVVLGPPICPPEQEEQLLCAFLEDSRPTIFLQLPETTARILRSLGLQVAKFGIESEIDLRKFDHLLSGKKFAALRRLRNKAIREGVEVRESSMTRICKTMRKPVQDMSAKWLKSKGGRAYTLLTRPLVLRDEADVRYFWAVRDDSLLALMVFDPMYRAGGVYGYFQNHIRYDSEAPHGTIDLLTLTAMRVFREEARELFSFGLSPLSISDNQPNAFPHERIDSLLQAVRTHGPSVYSFEGNEFFKRRYNPLTKPVFLATTGTGTIIELAIAMHTMKQFRLRDTLDWLRVLREFRRLMRVSNG